MKILKALLLSLLVQTNPQAMFCAKQTEPVTFTQRLKNAMTTKNVVLALSVGANVYLAIAHMNLLQDYPGLKELAHLRTQAGLVPGLQGKVNELSESQREEVEGLRRLIRERKDQDRAVSAEVVFHEGMGHEAPRVRTRDSRRGLGKPGRGGGRGRGRKQYSSKT